MKILNPLFWIITAILCIPTSGASQITGDTLRTIKLTAKANEEDENIRIQWEDEPGDNTY